MLSYRHAFHAGNFADVLKHIVLVEMLEHMVKKAKPFDYIDSHAGAGQYSLNSAEALKTAEAAAGINKLTAKDFPELSNYFSAIGDDPLHYPGSPNIARQYLRPGDRAWLFEKHPADFIRLNRLMGGNRSIRVSQDDGFAGLLAKVPPHSRRAVVLMDPSYELKTDYNEVATTLIAAHKKFATGSYALWYPVVERQRVNELERRFVKSGIRNIQLFELAMHPDLGGAGSGMTASGMLVINPPYTLMSKMQGLLPKLQSAIGGSGYRTETLAAE